MKQAIATGILVLAALGRADEASDRAGIERTIGALNQAVDEAAIRKLATAEAYNDLDRLFAPSRRPWSEVSRPHFTVQRIRFVAPDVALVDASGAQYGSTVLARRLSLLFVMTREKDAWRIASVRALAAP